MSIIEFSEYMLKAYPFLWSIGLICLLVGFGSKFRRKV